MRQRESNYRSPLREQQKAATRRLILEALAGEVAERGPADFSMQDVAARAGVALRTVYEHFRTRRDLVDALYAVIDEAFASGPAGQLALDSPEDLLEAVPLACTVFDENLQLSTAMVRLADADVERPASYHQHTAQFARALQPLISELPDREARQVLAVTRYLISSRAWYATRVEFGLAPEDASQIITRTLRSLFENVRRARDGHGGDEHNQDRQRSGNNGPTSHKRAHERSG